MGAETEDRHPGGDPRRWDGMHRIYIDTLYYTIYTDRYIIAIIALYNTTMFTYLLCINTDRYIALYILSVQYYVQYSIYQYTYYI
jgi:hypothetical protein